MYKDLPVERGEAESEQPVISTDEGRVGESRRMRMILEYEFIHLAFTNRAFFSVIDENLCGLFYV